MGPIVVLFVAAASMALGCHAQAVEDRCAYCASVARYVALHTPYNVSAGLLANCDAEYRELCTRAAHNALALSSEVHHCGAEHACNRLLGECPSSTTCFGPTNEKAQAAGGSVACDLCKTVISKARDALNHGKAIDSAINSICQGPLATQNACKSILSLGVAAIKTYLNKYTDNYFVCARIKLC